jgi:hypothetical protein
MDTQVIAVARENLATARTDRLPGQREADEGAAIAADDLQGAVIFHHLDAGLGHEFGFTCGGGS